MGGFGFASGFEPRVEHFVPEPPRKRGIAAVAGADGLLRYAGRFALGAGDPDVEVIVVAPHGPDLGHPAPVAGGFPAHRLLDRRIDEDALDLGLLRRRLDQGQMLGGPLRRVDVLSVGADHVGGRHHLALLARQVAVRHRRKPDVGIEPYLVRGMAGQHRAAPRLRNIAHQQARPALDRRHHLGEPFEEGDQHRIAPVAVAGQPHHLPRLPVDRQRLGAREAASA